MTTDQRQRVREVLAKALTYSPAEQEAFLSAACKDDREVRAQVESLLAHDSQAPTGFMRLPAEETGSRTDPLIGTHVARYHIKGVIAAGGMGTVYEAIQEQPSRTVALKVMNRHMTSKSVQRRFQFESQILAHLRHANIAQIFESGMHEIGGDKVPYFAMEYIPDAKSITEYAAENKLGTRERLQLFAMVCDAVHHGHQKGVIHRDLKPGNILVDGTGTPKIIDFGVARSVNSDLAMTTQQTEVGQLVGTLQYMSPEQCQGDVLELDTRSDVYALGVILYELLCEMPPYPAVGTSIQAVLQIICEKTPTTPSSVNRSLRGNLDLILLKALEKNRDNRYQSASELAQDVRRHLNREPLLARPPTAWTRLHHWTLRHPIAVTAIACVIMAVVTMIATQATVWYVHWQPHAIELASDHQEAYLYARNDHVLHTWKSNGPHIASADLIESTSPLAILGYSPIHTGPRQGSFCLFDLSEDYDAPLWTRRVQTTDLFPRQRERGFVGRDFGAVFCRQYDIFPEHPGVEILAHYAHGLFSARLIHIYDLSGKLLYQLWYDGDLHDVYWMADAQLLVFVGTNADAYWYERDYEVDTHYPYVLFAVKPQLGFIASGYLGVDTGAGVPKALWYQCLLPPQESALAGPFRLQAPPGAFEPGRSFSFGFDLKMKSGLYTSLYWVIDEFGNMVSKPIIPDAYKKDRAQLPDPAIFKFGELPPIKKSAEE